MNVVCCSHDWRLRVKFADSFGCPRKHTILILSNTLGHCFLPRGGILVEMRTQALEMGCYQRLLNIENKNQVNNEDDKLLTLGQEMAAEVVLAKFQCLLA